MEIKTCFYFPFFKHVERLNFLADFFKRNITKLRVSIQRPGVSVPFFDLVRPQNHFSLDRLGNILIVPSKTDPDGRAGANRRDFQADMRDIYFAGPCPGRHPDETFSFDD